MGPEPAKLSPIAVRLCIFLSQFIILQHTSPPHTTLLIMKQSKRLLTTLKLFVTPFDALVLSTATLLILLINFYENPVDVVSDDGLTTDYLSAIFQKSKNSFSIQIICVMILFKIFTKIGVFFHELGHYFFGRLAGFSIYSIELGIGEVVSEFRLNKTAIFFLSRQAGGLARPYPTDALYDRKKQIIFTIGGALVNLSFVLLGVWLFTSVDSYWPKFLLLCFLLANLLLVIIALWPRQFSRDGQDLSTDGLLILNYIFKWKNRDETSESDSASGLDLYQKIYDAQRLQLEKKYSDALLIFESIEADDSSLALVVRLNIALINLMLGNLEKALKLVNFTAEERQQFTPQALNILAWILLVQFTEESIAASLETAQRAYTQEKGDVALNGTYGCVLVATGHYREGAILLYDRAETKRKEGKPTVDQLFYGYACQQLQQSHLGDKEWTFVLENYEALPTDERMLFERAVREWNIVTG
jgi:hypothetical protein